MIDLHSHSTISDGTVTPAALAQLAADAGLTAVALTDHDTVGGIAEFQTAAAALGVEAVAGTEITTSWYNGSQVHILGLLIDPANTTLLALLERQAETRIGRNTAIVDRLRSMGFDLNMDEVIAEGGGDAAVIGRPHIARVLVNKGCVRDISDAFSRYIGNKGPAFVRRYLPPPSEVAEAIAAAGGVSVWAHPSGLHRPPASRIRKSAGVLKEAGIDGLEGYYSHYTPEQSQAVLRIAAELGMCVSGGSDFHGDNRPGVVLGVGCGDLSIDESVLEALKAYRDKHR